MKIKKIISICTVLLLSFLVFPNFVRAAEDEVINTVAETNINVTIPQSIDAVFKANTTEGTVNDFVITNHLDYADVQIESIHAPAKSGISADSNQSSNGFLYKGANFAQLSKAYGDRFALLLNPTKTTTAAAFTSTSSYEIAKHLTADTSFSTTYGNNSIISRGASKTMYMYAKKGVAVTTRQKLSINNLIVTLKLKPYPVMQTGTEFQTTIGSAKSNIVGIEFTSTIPDLTDYTSWDVSAAQNGSVMAWLDNNTSKLYIGGNGGVIANADCKKLFYDFRYVTSIKFNGLFDTSNMQNCLMMFSNCSNVTSIDTEYLPTNKVTDMTGMFQQCPKLTTLNMSRFDTSNVTSMHAMFADDIGLTSLDVSKFNTSKVNNMQYMFSNCSNLKTLNLNNFDTSNVLYMNQMFNQCSSLTTLTINSFRTAKVTNMNYMFNGCSKLTSLDLSRFDTSKVTRMDYMFKDCSSLVTLNIENFNTAKVTNMSYMFYSCYTLTNINVAKFNTSSVTNMSYMFYQCSKATFDVSGFDTTKVTNTQSMFFNCQQLKTSMTIRGNITNYEKMFQNTSIANSAYVLVKDNGSNGALVDKLISTKSSNSNVYRATLGISFDTTNLTVNKGTTGKITAIFNPDSSQIYTNKSMKWSSSDTNIATVASGGVVTGVSGGEATITLTATDIDGKVFSASCKVTVKPTVTVTFADGITAAQTIVFDKGMTWRQFVNSSYNTAGFTLNEVQFGTMWIRSVKFGNAIIRIQTGTDQWGYPTYEGLEPDNVIDETKQYSGM